MSAPYTQLVTPLSEYAMVCRACLAESGEMKNMFEWGLHKEFSKLTDVQMQRMDGISELICSSCEDALNTCKNFRSQCQQSDLLLRNSVLSKPTNDCTLNDITVEMTEEKLTISVTAPDESSKIYFNCPYNCPERYLKRKDLQLHLKRIHSKEFTVDIKYYCHHPDCLYYKGTSLKYFSGRKYLNQHFNKTHKSRLFDCDRCGKSFSTSSECMRHLKVCNMVYSCELCHLEYKTNDRLLVHLMRHHPDLHKSYKASRAEKRKAKISMESKKMKSDKEDICDSPKRSFATQTLLQDSLRNDVNFSTWRPRSDEEIKKDEISTQTVFEDLLSLKSQNSEDESLFETVSLSDIQTQTFPVEFGLNYSHKETLTSETQSPDLSMKETQTCVCLYDCSGPSSRLLDSVSSSPYNLALTSEGTQTSELVTNLKSDVLLNCNSGTGKVL